MQLPIKQERFMLILLAAAQFTNIMDFMIMMPLAPTLMRLMHISTQQFGWIVSAYTISAGISGLTSAFVIDKFDRKKALLFIYCGFTIGTFCCAFAPNYSILLSARIFTGLFGGIMGALVMSIVSDIIPYERRASAMSIIMAAFSLATVIGVPFGLFLNSKFSWHMPFIFLGSLAILFWGLLFFFIPNITSHLQNNIASTKINPLKTLTNIWQNNSQRNGLLLMATMMMGHFAVIPFLSKYTVSNQGFSEHQLTYIYLFGGIATVITSPLTGRLADKFGKKKLFLIALPFSFIPILLITNMPRVPMWMVLTSSTLFFIFATARMIPLQALISSTVEPKNRGAFMSINSSIQQFSAGVASLLAGYIVIENPDKTLSHYNYVGYFAVAMLCLCFYFITKVHSIESKKE